MSEYRPLEAGETYEEGDQIKGGSGNWVSVPKFFWGKPTLGSLQKTRRPLKGGEDGV